MGARAAAIRLGAGLIAALAVALPPARGAAEDLAVLQGLDKVTARISSIEAPIGRMVRFGALEIVARRCQSRPPDETPESTVWLEIDEVKPGAARTRVFAGWMFASSPALSALEHPVYDVWIVDCRNEARSSSPRLR
ncbi:MAG: DUF2155 domain-containing protein [Alphaproteobacteria bacterium]|nr:DUF2155 domain-containing protein [Alphaproteobacteria bacterium]